MRLPSLQLTSLKVRVVLTVALLFVTFASLLTWIALHHVDRSFRESLYSEQYALATHLANGIDDKLRLSMETLQQVAVRIQPSMLTQPEEAQAFLDGQAALRPIFTNGLQLISNQGRILVASPAVAGRRGIDASRFEGYIVVGRTGRPYITPPFSSTLAAGRPAITIALPLYDEWGRMFGRLHGSIELAGRNQIYDLNRIQLGRTGYASLFTENRIFISNRDTGRILKPIVAPGLNPLVDRAVAGFEGSESVVNSRGVEVISSFKHLQTVPWILSLNLPFDEAAEPLNEARPYVLLIIAGSAVLMVGLIWFVMRRALSPLSQLTRHVRELPGKTGGERQLMLRSSNEIGTLVDAFNELVQDLDRQQKIVRDSEARFRNLVQLSTEWFWETDEKHRFTDISQGLNDVGKPFMGKTRWEQPHSVADEQVWAPHKQHLDRREPFRDFIYQVRNPQGELRTLCISGTPFFDEQGVFRGYRGVGTDITERQKSEQRIEYLAYHDALTGLPNRLLAQDRFEQAMAHAEREHRKVALVYLDLDNFKTVNDTAGHAAGDRLLKDVAQRLRDCVREGDTVSRLGGDEFLLVLRDLPAREVVLPIVAKIMDKLQEAVPLEGNEFTVMASLGVACGPDDGRDFETLHKKADLAMYRSKEAGRNTYHFFDPAMEAMASEHLLIRNGLRRALDRQEFVLHYQPQFDLRTGALIGLEALVRWQHPEFGLVPPGRFISVAEESGLIVPLGDWILQQACRQAVAWQRAGLPAMTMAVNLSAMQFKRGQIELSVSRALAESDLPPALLELELTESILLQDVDSVLDSVRQLKLLGVKLAIDDFGTGYSSLSYLKRLDIDKLKIDQSFVRDLADDPDDAAIVAAIIQMARSLSLRTIGEGVETVAIRDRLCALGCDEAQGYLYARPLPATEVEQLIKTGQARSGLTC